MSDDVVISVEGLGKKYRLGQRSNGRYTALRDVIADKAKGLFGSRHSSQVTRHSDDFWALKDVSFEVKRGEVVGIIGRNGAGKSTLLKILSRITEPTEGRVRLKGRVASLLEVGTGFHPELTGRENIFLNGAILGMTKAEIKRKFDEIVAFAEIEKFLDTPVKRYSSGMYVRLAFAVAAHLEPEILVVDEVLAVGDVAFQKKCLGKMRDVSAGGRTVLFVSHNMQAIRQLCSRSMLLDAGQKISEGSSDDVIGQYLLDGQHSNSVIALNEHLRNLARDSVFQLHRVDIRQEDRSTTNLLTGKPVEISLTYEVFENTEGLHVYFLLYDVDGSLIFESLHNGDADEPFVARGSYNSTAILPADFLAGRNYELQIMAAIHCVRTCLPNGIGVWLHAHNAGRVNRAYSGYETPGKLAPLIPWSTHRLSEPTISGGR